MIIDTHTHLYLEEFDEDREDAMRRAADAGVGHLIFPNVDLTTVGPMKKLHAAYPECTSLAMGLHPTEVGDNWEEVLSEIESELRSGQKYVAVGEVGMDLYWDKSHLREQQLALDRQLCWADELRLPVIIHCREALDPILEVMEGHRDTLCVFHCFTGTATEVDTIRRRTGDHPYFGIGGVVTFKNTTLREVLPEITIDRILLETDSPYLAPVPHRGKRNESAFITNVADTVATSLSLPRSSVETATTHSAIELFRLPIQL